MEYNYTPKRESMKEWYKKAFFDLEKVITKVGDRRVTKIILCGYFCLQTFPCKGHYGVILTLDDGWKLTYDCESVSIGAIMVYYKEVDKAKVEKHCCEYIEPEFKNYLVKTFSHKEEEYWIGPYGIKVPEESVKFIVLHDNTLYRSESLVGTGKLIPDITEKEFKERYCKLIDGEYYYTS